MRFQNSLATVMALAFLCVHCATPTPPKELTKPEKTAFQTSTYWMPEIDVQSDIAIVYGANDQPNMSFKQRLESWKTKGYNTQFMTGMAWGDYSDFYTGQWDGQNHEDIAQLEKDGTRIMHGEGSPYVVPDSSFIAYMKEAIVNKVIDAGISTIYLEEPEFWARAGYSDHFKKAWLEYYGFPWRPQDTSVENTYLSNKLKYRMFYHAIDEVSTYAKEYGKSKGRDVHVFIPTHSLINYSCWEIVSPEASLASLPAIDGYIAQVWTGTSRTPNYFNGIKAERVFENAFLEYGCMVSMTEPTNRKVFLLTDPIEDGVRDWADYKKNYEATFTAKLLYPTINNYEVMPWPERIYTRPYKLTNSDEETLIPRFYSTQMQVMINSLNHMPKSENKVDGSHGIGVLMANSLMFQKFPTHDNYSDPLFSNFYGQVMPLIKRGIPAQIVHMENLGYKQSLEGIKVLVLSYSNMKPLDEKYHEQLSEWIKNGGKLIYCSADDDPYQQVMEWWNTGTEKYATPAAHLFKLLGITPSGNRSDFAVGHGHVWILKTDPKSFVMQPNGDENYLQIASEAYSDTTGQKLQFKNHFLLQRGPFDIVSVMDENSDTDSFTVAGPVIDLFDPTLPVLTEKKVEPGSQAFLFNLSRIENPEKPQVLASAARVYNETITEHSYSFVAKSPQNTTNVMRVLLPKEPLKLKLTNSEHESIKADDYKWDESTRSLLLVFENSPDGINALLQW